MLLLTAEEYAAPDEQPQLRERWFRVPQETDDRKYAEHVRFILKTMRKEPAHTLSYNIFTTTDCNARCFYCFEMGRSRVSMSEETAHRAAAYIAAHCGSRPVKLGWFGGEPLFNRTVIDTICTELTRRGVDYRSTMMSNGYLFDDETVRRAAALWKLRRVQITLDGTEAVYNRCKAYVYRGGQSPYRIVLANIGRLLEAGILVVIRLNMDKHNAEDLTMLVDELHERFAGENGLRVYSHLLFEFAGSEPRIRSDEDRRRLCAAQDRLSQRLEQYGMDTKHRLRRELPLNQCMADSGSALTILPGGELGLCDHYSENNFAGTIDGEGLDAEVVRRFRECREDIPECAGCVIYPECVRLKQCPSSERCYPETREQTRRKILHAMLNTYDAWHSEQDAEEENDPEPC